MLARLPLYCSVECATPTNSSLFANFPRNLANAPLPPESTHAHSHFCPFRRHHRNPLVRLGSRANILSVSTPRKNYFMNTFNFRGGWKYYASCPLQYPLYDSDLRATHARTLLPAVLASVSFGFVFVRVRVKIGQQTAGQSRAKPLRARQLLHKKILATQSKRGSTFRALVLVTSAVQCATRV